MLSLSELHTGHQILFWDGRCCHRSFNQQLGRCRQPKSFFPVLRLWEGFKRNSLCVNWDLYICFSRSSDLEDDFLCKARIVFVLQQNGEWYVSYFGCSRKLEKIRSFAPVQQMWITRHNQCSNSLLLTLAYKPPPPLFVSSAFLEKHSEQAVSSSAM
ncbi:hypothetical protein Bca4012_009958 [Brassica carinata]